VTDLAAIRVVIENAILADVDIELLCLIEGMTKKKRGERAVEGV
jgi:hypothetical protein